MAHNYVTTGNRLTMGSQGGAGIFNDDFHGANKSKDKVIKNKSNLKVFILNLISFLRSNHCFISLTIGAIMNQ